MREYTEREELINGLTEKCLKYLCSIVVKHLPSTENDIESLYKYYDKFMDELDLKFPERN